jgi:hypothetical protein
VAVGSGAGAAYARCMDAVLADLAPVLAAKVWHYWIAVPLVAGALLAILATIVGYLKKVQSLKYPPQQ